jgi:alanyl-tRNA synthetase
LTEAARLLSTAPEAVPALVAKEVEELRASARAREKLVKRLAEYEARELWQAAPERQGRRVVRRVFDAEEYDEAKMVAHAVARQPSALALIGVRGKPGALFFAQSPGGSADVGAILKRTVEKFGGKGGGARDFAQGGGLEEGSLEEALSWAESRIA